MTSSASSSAFASTSTSRYSALNCAPSRHPGWGAFLTLPQSIEKFAISRMYRPRFLGQLVDGHHAASWTPAARASRVAAGVLKPCFSTNQPLLLRCRNDSSSSWSSATVSYVLIQRSCSLRVRKKRSTQPLPSGSRTYAGDGLIPQKPHFSLEVVAHELTPVVMAQSQTCGTVVPVGAEGKRHRLAQGFHGLPARHSRRAMEAQALVGAVVDQGNDAHCAVPERHRRSDIDGPHLVGSRGGDGAVVRFRAVRPGNKFNSDAGTARAGSVFECTTT